MKKIIFVCILVASPIIASGQAIFDAIRANDQDKVKALLVADKTLVNLKNGYGDTPLHIAALVDNDQIAKLLIEYGADLDVRNASLYTPLMRAGLKVSKVLVKSGADINFVSPNGQSTALFGALMWKDKEVAEYLLKSGAKIPEKGNRRFRINLINATKKGIIQYLNRCLKNGLDPLFSGESQSSLLHYAAESNSTAWLDKLFALGVPFNRANIFGWAPIHNAAYYGNQVTVEWFIKKGADLNARTIDGHSPYNLAVEAKNTDVINFLKTIGADQSPQQFPELTGDYLGQTKPGRDPIPFAPGIIAATRRFHSTIAFSRSGDEAYWGCPDILYSMRKNGKWTKPETSPLMEKGDAPFFSPDGKRLYFIAFLGKGMWGREAIFFIEKRPSGWSESKPIPDIINSNPGIHCAFSVDLKGNLYFGARQKGTVVSRIYYSKHLKGTYSKPMIMAHLKDTDANSPYISPDGNYLIFMSEDSGLMVSFRKKHGYWTEGKRITEFNEYPDRCPIVSHDGKFLFFLRFVDDRYIPFWVDARIIEEFNPKNSTARNAEKTKIDEIVQLGGALCLRN
jgi:ankyrin repeat protein